MNRKRKVNTLFLELGRHKLSRKDILALEDIVCTHMEEVNKIRHKQRIRAHTKTDDVREYRLIDTYIEVSSSWLGGRGIELFKDGYAIKIGVEYEANYDSIKNLPLDIPIRYLKISGKPGLYLSFSPLHTKLTAKRAEAGNEERKSMDTAVRQIESYFAHRASHRKIFNKILS